MHSNKKLLSCRVRGRAESTRAVCCRHTRHDVRTACILPPHTGGRAAPCATLASAASTVCRYFRFSHQPRPIVPSQPVIEQLQPISNSVRAANPLNSARSFRQTSARGNVCTVPAAVAAQQNSACCLSDLLKKAKVGYVTKFQTPPSWFYRRDATNNEAPNYHQHGISPSLPSPELSLSSQAPYLLSLISHLI